MNKGRKYLDYFIVSYSYRMKPTTWFIMKFSEGFTRYITHTIARSIIRGDLELPSDNMLIINSANASCEYKNAVSIYFCIKCSVQ